MPWKNGEIPESDLIIFKRGYNKTDGNWFWGLSPQTYLRHLKLVELAKKRTGKTLEPGDGWSTYRPYPAQVKAREIYGNGAAVPRTSSHGGYWEGRETLAIDYSNWSWVYNGDRQAFFADVRAAGLEPDMISPRRGYPDEPWHVIDLNPRSGPAFSGSNATPAQILEENNDMPVIIVREDNPGQIIMIDGTGITRPINEKAVELANYVGIKGNWNINRMSKNDFRQTVELFGFDYNKLMTIGAGQRLLADGRVVNAGVNPWPGSWE